MFNAISIELYIPAKTLFYSLSQLNFFDVSKYANIS